MKSTLSRTIIAVIFCLALISVMHAATPPDDPIRSNPKGVGIDGYSPVSYYTAGHPEKGSADFASANERK
ncbi:MAG: hypothetical protein ACI9H8_001140 [Lysobacterales bacterium]|jgi:hypothetical protein